MFQKREIKRRKELLAHGQNAFLAMGLVLFAFFPTTLSAQTPTNSFCGPFERTLKAEFPDLQFSRNDDYGNECQMSARQRHSQNLVVEIIRFSSTKPAKHEFARNFKIFSLGYEMRSGGTYGTYATQVFWSDAMVLKGTNDDTVILLRVDNYVLTLISLDWQFLVRAETGLRARTLYK